MMLDYDENMIFEDVQDGQTSVYLSGYAECKQQEEKAATYFSRHLQTINSLEHLDDTVEVLGYRAELDVDLPNGPKRHQVISLSGTPIFYFSENRIIKTDII